MSDLSRIRTEAARANAAVGPVYLGDGAYVSLKDGQVVLTANHHDPTEATDVVYLDPQGAQVLVRWLQVLLKNGE